MEFLKKYWWVILGVVVLGVILYMWMEDKKAIIAPKKKTDCTGFTTAIEAMEDNIDDDADWKKLIEDKTTNEEDSCYGISYEACRKKNAIWVLKEQGVIPKSCVIA